jgi:hypothetical protein
MLAQAPLVRVRQHAASMQGASMQVCVRASMLAQAPQV